ncbi:hypothetical protein DLR11_19675 [Salmonella enterica subsp. salamae]|uniref:Uncharacterized protein n=2 Tax=Salmonella enterica subsp. salamae TaxID=59202 RepID=A0A6C7CP55_SALER|nr:hypothetical protein LFZ47_19875 [Salmonella enterica subsp. salamae serovar 55:k:z39 str. 1315K]ECC1482791.1 hypothetical protein [Salmonella enterica subsp. salamae]EEL7720474.1 hypothetical protein [Salmonella enterica]ECC1657309.1 hypothetical protein [Salmonella enterica subsp. salamae]ECC1692211.1 hypothetical protein [Salmonella enterica subsp. salamae]
MRLICPSGASVRVITFNWKKLPPELTLVIFTHSGLLYSKGTSTRLIRSISIGVLALFHGTKMLNEVRPVSALVVKTYSSLCHSVFKLALMLDIKEVWAG